MNGLMEGRKGSCVLCYLNHANKPSCWDGFNNCVATFKCYLFHVFGFFIFWWPLCSCISPIHCICFITERVSIM